MKHKQAHTTLVNGVETSAIMIADRGLAYGDGLFETMRVVDDRVPLLEYHLKRFARGVDTLALGSVHKLKAAFTQALQEAMDTINGDALVKIIVTRGVGGRGYAAPSRAECTFVAQVYDPIEPSPFHPSRGITIAECDFRLGLNPALAGIKHLNRLEQVLACRSLKEMPEGLLFDLDDNLIEGTKSNVLLFEPSGIITPRLHRAGVCGTLRDYLLDAGAATGFPIAEEDVSRERYQQASGLALINSVSGLRQVKAVSCQHQAQVEFSFDQRAAKIHAHLRSQFAY